MPVLPRKDLQALKETVKILALGDIVGQTSAERVCKILSSLKREFEIDFTIANGENAANGNGLDRNVSEMLFSHGIDLLTSGNHIWKKHSMQDYISENEFILRPANYPSGTPGRGSLILEKNGLRVLVMNVLGTVYMEPLKSPFDAIEEILTHYKGCYDISLLDIHAEATSEKQAVARFFDGKISAVFGTHTHVQTSDERVFPNGTGFITDIGMCGAKESILGVSCEDIIKKFRTRMPVKFTNPSSETEINGAVFEIDIKSHLCKSVKAIRKTVA